MIEVWFVIRKWKMQYQVLEKTASEVMKVHPTTTTGLESLWLLIDTNSDWNVICSILYFCFFGLCLLVTGHCKDKHT